jgi:hypothetical protein
MMATYLRRAKIAPDLVICYTAMCAQRTPGHDDHALIRLRTTHKANELLTRAGVIADHAE